MNASKAIRAWHLRFDMNSLRVELSLKGKNERFEKSTRHCTGWLSLVQCKNCHPNIQYFISTLRALTFALFICILLLTKKSSAVYSASIDSNDPLLRSWSTSLDFYSVNHLRMEEPCGAETIICILLSVRTVSIWWLFVDFEQRITWSLFSVIYRINVVESIRYTCVKDYLMVMHVVCRRPNVAHPIENDELDTIHVDGRERYRQIPLVRTSFFVRRMCFEKWKLRFAPLILYKLVEVRGDEG